MVFEDHIQALHTTLLVLEREVGGEMEKRERGDEEKEERNEERRGEERRGRNPYAK